ncbi:MAG: globin [Austwickia sp.]|nr:globin [Austwickia sp.]
MSDIPLVPEDGAPAAGTPGDGVSAGTPGAARTPYESMGGAATFAALTREFYRGVAQDPLLRPMYPEADLEPARERLELFLAQYWGGPTTYSDRRGHPRLRMRHMGFAVTPAARDAWLRHMLAAVDTLDLEPTDEAMLRDYLTRAAYSLVNRME